MTKRKKQHSPEQIVRKIQDADRILAQGGDVAAVLKELNITDATYYLWRNHYGGLKAEDAKKQNGSDAGVGGSFSYAARAAGVAIIVSNSIGVKRPNAA